MKPDLKIFRDNHRYSYPSDEDATAQYPWPKKMPEESTKSQRHHGTESN